MGKDFVIYPRIKVINQETLEISFHEEEIINCKTSLKNQMGEIVPININFKDISKLITEVDNQIRQSNINVSTLLECINAKATLEKLKEIPVLKDLFFLKQPIWEGYTTEQHSLGVAQNLTAINTHQERSKLLEIAALFHDIGKPVAAFFKGDAKKGRSKQDKYNLWITKTALEALNFNEAQIKYILTLIGNSRLIYNYIVGDCDLPTIKDELYYLRHSLSEVDFEISLIDLVADLKSLWLADGSDYSMISCILKGQPIKPSFDSQFIFSFSLKDEKWNLSKISLKSSWEDKYARLVKKLQSE